MPPAVARLASAAVSVHSPYSTGECSLCHEGKDPKKPGPARRPVNKTCYFCHEDLGTIMTGGKFKHATAVESCTNCHNPHNAREKKLLVAKVPDLCLDCHATTRTLMAGSVKHAALSEGSSCGNCHSPHASEVEHVLLRLPYDQCIGCHDKDDVKDAKGKTLTNIKKLLAENPVHHAPVAQKDCSSCHETHGSNHARLAVAEYPAQFYAPFEPANYALCFRCHDERAVTMPETLTETRFRDGKRNLHFVHVNKADRGRICRACHEVHASKQAYLIRDSVPYGSSGWMLQVGFTKNADGGTCDKTCHTAKTYVNTLKTAAKVGG
jgi:predicted CXXCH cytochrome family protein